MALADAVPQIHALRPAALDLHEPHTTPTISARTVTESTGGILTRLSRAWRRLPWGLLHVTDPSSRTIVRGATGPRDPSAARTDGFRFVVEAQPRSAGQNAAGDLLPRLGRGFAPPPLWQWPTWETPRWHAERKPLFEAMRETFAGIPEDGRRP